MKIIGLTGKTGSGKSTVSKMLGEQGWAVIDADKVAREVVEKGKPALKKLCEEFSDNILFEDGSLNRKKLAEIAFSSKENTEKLNKTTHPFITKIIEEKIKIAEENHEFCLIDAAALLESECKNLCEKIVVIDSPENVRLARIKERDNITNEDAVLRIRAQKDDGFYLEKADLVIVNGEGESLREIVRKIIEFAEGIK